ncbi:MAG: hypothetical protein KDK48_03585 [Chlamydiia bacterium]|nr:hypothetical protein [Chlamydiia bacterium]
MTFPLKKENVFALPILHYTMEMAAFAKRAIHDLKPDAIAVELPETMHLQMLHAASRLPDLSVVLSFDRHMEPIYFMCEPCDACFEALRTGLESQIPSFCIDLDVDEYPDIFEAFPDPYSITRIGLENYYHAYAKLKKKSAPVTGFDMRRELYMAKRLKELSLQYDKVLFISGMVHAERVLELMERPYFAEQKAAKRESTQVITVTEESSREVMAEYGWISTHYETARKSYLENPEDAEFPPDRQKLILQLFREAGTLYEKNSRGQFPPYALRNLMKFARNYALVKGGLMPDLYQLLSAAKGCVEHNYAYEVWELATAYEPLKNVDGIEAVDLTAEDLWGDSKPIRFHLKEKGKKDFFQMHRQRKDRKNFRFEPPGPFTICSYPPEDIRIENFGEFLKKKGTQLTAEEGARVAPFTASLEDGIDMRETIRHFAEGKLYVKVKGKPPGGVGSVVVIFDEDSPHENRTFTEKYPWKTTWLGEHAQESDMAFYSTPIASNVVGPGISRCEYGGFMMSYPPRRMFDVWSDPDYMSLRTKCEVLLAAAIDYSVQPLITYVAAAPPRQALKSYARRFGKKIVYIPIGQLSPVTLRSLRTFHVLDGHDRRSIADEYIE